MITAPSPKASVGRVFCLPAHDEADEITAAMLAQLLMQAGCAALSLPLDPSLQAMIELLKPEEKDMFCISALPPFAFGRAKKLSLQLQERFPGTKVIVGVWGHTGDPERALQGFQPKLPDRLVTSLSDALAFLLA